MGGRWRRISWAALLVAFIAIGTIYLWKATWVAFPTTMRPGVTPLTSHELTHRASELIDAYHAISRFSGVVLMAFEGKVIFEKAYGVANPATGVHVDISTTFSIGSLTKQFTGFLVHNLIHRGQMAKTDRVEQYLPALQGKPVGAATIGHLLHMTSGLPHSLDLWTVVGLQLSRRPISETDFVAHLATYELAFEPGSAFLYSDVGYALLAVVLQRVTGQSWESLVQEQIFEPYEMTHSGSFLSIATTTLATGQIPARLTPFGDRVSLICLPRWNYSHVRGASGVYATVRDLYKWHRALVATERQDATLYQRFVTPGPDHEYASGLMLSQRQVADGGRVTIQLHPGEVPGYFSFFARIPELDAVVIMLSNSDYGLGRSNYHLDRELLNLLTGYPYRIAE